jgi:hypothetical protein
MITIAVPDNASLQDVIKAFVMILLRMHQSEVKVAKQIGKDPSTLGRWLDKWGIIVAYVPDGPNVIPARQRKKSGAARALLPSKTPPPEVKPAGLQAIIDEAAKIRADHERRASGGRA